MAKKGLLFIIFFTIGFLQVCANPNDEGNVKIWKGILVIPSFKVDKSEKSPCFMYNFAYQRAKRCIYPYAMDDNITNERGEKEYKALYLENEFVKVCVLPELGGRILYAIDKTNNYDLFYHQTVIKPANIGMSGAWISGGVEWNAFHHHRVTSQLTVDYKLVENEDGSKTIWVGETEYRHRMKWDIGITLYPNKSFMEISGRLINSTQNKNSFLYWSNVATHANENYQIIFPESTDLGVMHAKNSFCRWPVTDASYNSLDYYKNNIDASWWKNNHDLVSIFAYNLKDGFIAGYDHGQNAGTMLVGNVNIVTGGKFFLWGPGAYGKKWDSEVLTESNGPYVELMVGSYSDNQPDYSWLNPYEAKIFTNYWYGIHGMEGAKAGNTMASLNMEFRSGNKVFVAANTTETMHSAEIKIENIDGRILYRNITSIGPDKPFAAEVRLPVTISGPTDVKLLLSEPNGKEIITYQALMPNRKEPMPETVKPTPKPEEIETVEELYLTGLRNKQFHNAFINPLDYFEEALKRDPYDIRCNTQMGIYYREMGDYNKAAFYLRNAIKRLTKDYTRPYDCEPLYHLGMVLKEQGKLTAAVDTLYRAAWDLNFMSPAYFQLAQISVQNNDYTQALIQLGQSLTGNSLNLNARNFKTTILRLRGDLNEAESLAEGILAFDPLNTYAQNEKYRIAVACKSPDAQLRLEEFNQLIRDQPEAYIEIAVSYMNNGFAREAEEILNRAEQSAEGKLKNYPTIQYYLGYLSDIKGDKPLAEKYFKYAVSLPEDYCFPFRLETEKVYKKALEYLPYEAITWYYRGNLFYDKQPDLSMECWKRAIKYRPDFAMAFRNIGWGSLYHLHDTLKAIDNYEKAVSLDHSQALWFTELDRIYELAGTDIHKRCKILEENHETVIKRYESFVREIRMLINVGEYTKAIHYLTNHYFSRQEGVNNLHDIYTDACILNGLKLMHEEKFSEAYMFFIKADEYPDNQNYARWEVYPRNAQIYYLTGKSLEESGRLKDALEFFKMAAATNTTGDFYGYTKGPQYDYYRAMAIKEIEGNVDVMPVFEEMIMQGEASISDNIDNFFISFGTGKTRNEINSEAYYTIGLGYYGKGDLSKAKEYFDKTLQVKPDHVWAAYYLANINWEV